MMRNISTMLKVLLRNPRMAFVEPSITKFMCSYMNRFRVRKVGQNLILHSHLPPLNSRAYSKFVEEHLIKRVSGPSHAQIAITNACPQNCEYCYNKDRTGRLMSKETILRVAGELKDMGVVWLGVTGGEPLLNKDIVEIISTISNGCAVKLFTTGCGLTPQLAAALKDAGLFSVSVSLDHWNPEVHNKQRGYKNAFDEAIGAVEMFRNTAGMDVGISAVLTPEMIRSDDTDRLLEFIAALGVHEAWLSELKPTIEPFWNRRIVITEEDRQKLVHLQNRYNSDGKMTVNYLGHFEGRECFGCNAGRKMIYVDAFGDVSPCVFTPMNFGNVREEGIGQIFSEIRSHFQPGSHCFINCNYGLLRKYSEGRKILPKAESIKLMDEVRFGELSVFFQLYYGTNQISRAVNPKKMVA